MTLPLKAAASIVLLLLLGFVTIMRFRGKTLARPPTRIGKHCGSGQGY
jgi:hypothetical protein